MATIDEQRKRFEKWFTDTVLRRVPQPGQYFERDDVGGYIAPTVHDMWRGYVAGEQARDAEVQALREALETIVELSRKPLTGGFEFALAFHSAEKVARAALAGGEAGEAE